MKINSKLSILVFFLIFVIVEIITLIGIPKNSTEYSVELRNEGFFPKDLIISKGDTVKFTSSRNTFFQPASDPHPVHNRYGAFDPKRPILGNESWSFTFKKVGDWNYHDHLEESFTGTIVVKGHLLGQKLKLTSGCKNVKGDARGACWDEMIKKELHQKGIAAAFEVFADLYATEEDFVLQGCHWTSHAIGEEAYELFRQGKAFELTPTTAYCGYGFYHGYMQLLLRDNPDMKEAQKFCNFVDDQLRAQAPLARLNCYHGIGHGFIEDPPDPKVWGDTEALLAQSLEICPTVSDRPIEIGQCHEGAYNGLVLFMEANKYGFTLDRENLLDFCTTQPEDVREHCYYEFAQKLDYSTNWDVLNVLPFMDHIKTLSLRQMIIRVAVGGMMQRDIIREDNSDYIFKCRSLPENLRKACINGVLNGFYSHGEPEFEFVKALEFCRSDQLTFEEKDNCYNTLVGSFRQAYSKEKVEEVCEGVEAEFKNYCN